MRKKSIISYAQTQLPFRGTTTRTLAHPFGLERRLLAGVGVAAIVLSVVYGYCVASSVANVAFRAQAMKESRTLSADVAALESRYLSETRGITPEYARSLGFVSPTAKSFVTRQGVVSYR